MLALLSHWQILMVLIVILLLFGNRIPGMARALGSGIVEFKKGLRGEDDEEKGKKGLRGEDDKEKKISPPGGPGNSGS